MINNTGRCHIKRQQTKILDRLPCYDGTGDFAHRRNARGISRRQKAVCPLNRDESLVSFCAPCVAQRGKREKGAVAGSETGGRVSRLCANPRTGKRQLSASRGPKFSN
jgi:hypothetical protein